MKCYDIEYRVQDTNCRGYIVEPKSQGIKLPGIVMYTDFWGINPRQKKVAEKLANMGAVVLDADMYGNQQYASTGDEAGKLMNSVIENSDIYIDRIFAPFELLKRNSNVNTSKLFSIGYCFGGASSLQLARYVEGLTGAISLHGLLTSKIRVPSHQKMPKMLILHGARDPLVSSEDIKNFYDEMIACNADFTFVSHGMSTHAFSNEDAAGNEVTAYHYLSDRRSDSYIKMFINENL